MFGPVALHYRLKLYISGPYLSRLEYIAGHPDNLGPRVESMNSYIETKNHFVCEVVTNDFNLVKLGRAAGRINRDQYISRLAGGQVCNVFSSIGDFLPVESKCSDGCDCGENTPRNRAPALQPIS